MGKCVDTTVDFEQFCGEGVAACTEAPQAVTLWNQNGRDPDKELTIRIPENKTQMRQGRLQGQLGILLSRLLWHRSENNFNEGKTIR